MFAPIFNKQRVVLFALTLLCSQPVLPASCHWAALWSLPPTGTDKEDAPADAPSVAAIADPVLLLEHNGVQVTMGYGSALAADPANPNRFFLLTDRGPNVDTAEDHIAFLIPAYAPRIGHFELVGSSLKLLSEIELQDSTGKKLSGLPRKPGEGGTGEVPEDTAGKVLEFDSTGIDSEGLVALADGGFWVSDEYGPSLLHVNAEGRTIERLDPYSKDGRRLPQVLRRRRPNRGMEGLTITPDGKTLVGMMESSLDNPSKDVRKRSRVVRLLFLDIATAKTRQYAYMQETAGISNSDIAAVGDSRFLVLERDRKRPGDEKDPAKMFRVYEIDIRQATDVSDAADGPEGRLVEGKTLEQLSPEQLEKAGIRPVAKKQVADLLAIPGGYPHDKPEGLAVLGNDMIVVSNDNDFGVDDDGKGGVVPKTLPAGRGSVDRTRLYFVRLPEPLR